MSDSQKLEKKNESFRTKRQGQEDCMPSVLEEQHGRDMGGVRVKELNAKEGHISWWLPATPWSLSSRIALARSAEGARLSVTAPGPRRCRRASAARRYASVCSSPATLTLAILVSVHARRALPLAIVPA